MASNPCPGLVLGCRAATAPRHPLSLATVPVISPFLLPALGGAPQLIAHRTRRGWQDEGSLGKLPGGGTPGQMPGACSSRILGCCTHSCGGPLGCKPHHVHLPQGEINQSYMCTVMPANGQTPTPSSQLLIISVGSVPHLRPCLL